MKSYHAIPIQECGEPLVPIPLTEFSVVRPHPYVALGAPYGDKSPYYLRSAVLAALQQAQRHLQVSHPGWQIRLFDAYRPVTVQQFMVDYTFADLVRQQGLDIHQLTPDQHQGITQAVFEFWAPPSPDPATPPPHSTGAALDVTLADAQGTEVSMGSPIDEVSPRSLPNHFAACTEGPETSWHNHRCLLNQVMTVAGFRRHPNEWWHFSLGDQLWAWLQQQDSPEKPIVARYGRADLLTNRV